jgi:enterochelin esterase-like enzyme
MNGFLALNVVTGPLIFSAFAVAAAFALYLLIRKPTARWIATALIGILVGALVGTGALLVVNTLKTFGEVLPRTAEIWVIGTFAAVALAVVNLWNSRWWRKVIAAIGIVVFAVTGTLGVNAYYGLYTTVGAMLGMSTEQPIDVLAPKATDPNAPDPTTPLYESWKPPADMPKEGKTGQLTGANAIPNTLSGFSARNASVYFPPAALVPNPPRLPFVLLMMGQPGSPDPQFIASVLNKDQAANKGLAPIVVVADQLGDPSVDPACADSAKFGKAETYITKDVVGWAKSHLNILHSPKYWTIAGYSNGGACAFKYSAQAPDTWDNLLDVSGDEFPGVEIQQQTIAQVFGGNAAAFDAAKPTSILKQHSYPNTTAIFTVGQNDTAFVPGAERNSKAAAAAGWKTTFYVVPGAGHVVDALDGGLTKGFQVLYPRLGLSKP